MAITAQVVRIYRGFVSRSVARDREGMHPTADRVWHRKFGRPPDRWNMDEKDIQLWDEAPNDDDLRTAAEALEWAVGEFVEPEDVSQLSDYGYNCRQALLSGVVTGRSAGIVASLYGGMMRSKRQAVEREARTKQTASSQHFGKVGEKVVLENVTIMGTRVIEGGQWGSTTLVTFLTADGNVAKWFASGWPFDFEVPDATGKVIHIKGTIKSHGEYRGVPETQLTRVSVAKAGEKPKGPKKAPTRAKKVEAFIDEVEVLGTYRGDRFGRVKSALWRAMGLKPGRGSNTPDRAVKLVVRAGVGDRTEQVYSEDTIMEVLEGQPHLGEIARHILDTLSIPYGEVAREAYGEEIGPAILPASPTFVSDLERSISYAGTQYEGQEPAYTVVTRLVTSAIALSVTPSVQVYWGSLAGPKFLRVDVPRDVFEVASRGRYNPSREALSLVRPFVIAAYMETYGGLEGALEWAREQQPDSVTANTGDDADEWQEEPDASPQQVAEMERVVARDVYDGDRFQINPRKRTSRNAGKRTSRPSKKRTSRNAKRTSREPVGPGSMGRVFGTSVNPDRYSGSRGGALDAAMDRYEVFHDKAPLDVVRVEHDPPRRLVCLGEALSTSYRTDKWYDDGKDVDYKHLHDESEGKRYATGRGVRFYENADFATREDVRENGASKPPMAYPRAWTRLGLFLGCDLQRHDGEYQEIDAGKSAKGCWLLSSPEGNMLAIYSPEPQADGSEGFLAILCGGRLRVEEGGIDG
ncbi:MAG: hypothetical protein HC882_06080 [Acidobacteria bacterium]|nr:hypothetical protein [Acidobacteriota bacterium]